MDGLFAQSVADAFQAFDDAREREEPGPSAAAAAELERPGTRIGRYDLVARLGEGGFGIVWRAEQARPVRREVALKIIKPGMDTCEVIARFQAERQALAVMDHPHIAKVFDAGATPAGRPFFVMELVCGDPITKYCARARRPVSERLALFIEVCRAVQHAHQKGILHRDLKPSNLLVAEHDGQPVVKIIDFGIAKATGAERLTEHTLVTHAGRLIGTPAYMSPEQSTPGLDADTRSDVYSLGVVLYELLTGAPPFTSEEVMRGASADPPRPSMRLRSLSAGALAEFAHASQVQPAALIACVKGDLDWIAMKALERDRTRRYDSAEALAADLERHLRIEPVIARPPTTAYLLRRYAQRHKGPVSAVAALVFILVAATVVSTSLYLKQRTALAQSEQVSRFLKKVLAQAGVQRSLGRDDTMMREILDETAASVSRELQGQPAVEAELRTVIGSTYLDLSQYQHAHEQASAAIRLQRQLHHGDDDELAEALLTDGDALEQLGQSKEAEAVLREALAMRQRLFGNRDLRTASVHALLAWTLMKAKRPLEGEASARLAVEVWRQHPRDPGLINAVKALYAICHNTNRHDEAIALMQEELASLRQSYGPEHPDIANCLDNLGVEFVRLQRFAEAEPVLQEALRQSSKFYHGHDPIAYHIYAALSRVAAARQQWDLQLKYAREGLAAASAVYPAGHRYHRENCAVLAGALLQQAQRLADEALRPDASPEAANAAAAQASAFVDEICASAELAATPTAAPAWLDCIRAAVLLRDPTQHDEARGRLANRVAAMKQKAKPTSDDTKRLQQAERWLLAGQGLAASH